MKTELEDFFIKPGNHNTIYQDLEYGLKLPDDYARYSYQFYNK
mgnify:CR=1 FL=1